MAASTVSCSSRWSVASALAATASSVCPPAPWCVPAALVPRPKVKLYVMARWWSQSTGTRWTSSKPTRNASRSPCARGCLDFVADWQATSATTRFATSKRNSRPVVRPTPWVRPTSCCCNARSSRLSTTSRASCTSSSMPTRRSLRPMPAPRNVCVNSRNCSSIRSAPRWSSPARPMRPSATSPRTITCARWSKPRN